METLRLQKLVHERRCLQDELIYRVDRTVAIHDPPKQSMCPTNTPFCIALYHSRIVIYPRLNGTQ